MTGLKDNDYFIKGLTGHDVTVLERAFELARTGQYRNKGLILKALKKEGYPRCEQMLHGASIGRGLREATLEGRRQIEKDDAAS